MPQRRTYNFAQTIMAGDSAPITRLSSFGRQAKRSFALIMTAQSNITPAFETRSKPRQRRTHSGSKIGLSRSFISHRIVSRISQPLSVYTSALIHGRLIRNSQAFLTHTLNGTRRNSPTISYIDLVSPSVSLWRRSAQLPTPCSTNERKA